MDIEKCERCNGYGTIPVHPDQSPSGEQSCPDCLGQGGFCKDCEDKEEEIERLKIDSEILKWIERPLEEIHGVSLCDIIAEFWEEKRSKT